MIWIAVGVSTALLLIMSGPSQLAHYKLVSRNMDVYRARLQSQNAPEPTIHKDEDTEEATDRAPPYSPGER